MNELDDLLNDLSNATVTQTQSAKPTDPDTSELDDLLHGLDDLQPQVQPQKPAPQVKQPSRPVPPQQQQQQKQQQQQQQVKQQAHQDLNKIIQDNPVQSARSSMAPTGKNVCYDCQQPVTQTSELLMAIGRSYHRQHFKCTGCQTSLTQNQFFERDGNPYCQNCMNTQICAYCSEAIKGRCIQALNQQWHPDHFFCSQCGKQFPPGVSFLEKDGKAYCEEDYYNMFAPKCGKCDLPILEEVVSALGKSWHSECFTCAETGCTVILTDGGSFFDYDGKPFCELHYHQARGSLCASCMKPVTGRCITASGRKFHVDHFVCAYCKKQLASNGAANASTFKDKDNKPYCVPCYVKLYG